eukprot:PhM_4_TR18630/c5_g1_i2/m.80037
MSSHGAVAKTTPRRAAQRPSATERTPMRPMPRGTAEATTTTTFTFRPGTHEEVTTIAAEDATRTPTTTTTAIRPVTPLTPLMPTSRETPDAMRPPRGTTKTTTTTRVLTSPSPVDAPPLPPTPSNSAWSFAPPPPPFSSATGAWSSPTSLASKIRTKNTNETQKTLECTQMSTEEVSPSFSNSFFLNSSQQMLKVRNSISTGSISPQFLNFTQSISPQVKKQNQYQSDFCTACRNFGHNSKKCPQWINRCYKCGITGHISIKCGKEVASNENTTLFSTNLFNTFSFFPTSAFVTDLFSFKPQEPHVRVQQHNSLLQDAYSRGCEENEEDQTKHETKNKKQHEEHKKQDEDIKKHKEIKKQDEDFKKLKTINTIHVYCGSVNKNRFHLEKSTQTDSFFENVPTGDKTSVFVQQSFDNVFSFQNEHFLSYRILQNVFSVPPLTLTSSSFNIFSCNRIQSKIPDVDALVEEDVSEQEKNETKKAKNRRKHEQKKLKKAQKKIEQDKSASILEPTLGYFEDEYTEPIFISKVNPC